MLLDALNHSGIVRKKGAPLSTGRPIEALESRRLLSGSISGVVLHDLTGNGLTADDVPLSGGSVRLYRDVNTNGVLDATDGAAIATAITAVNGSFSFGNLAVGHYLIADVPAAGAVRTAPALSNTYAVNVNASANFGGFRFDNFIENFNSSSISNISFLINGTQVVSTLAGNVHQGDTVQARFTVAAGQTVTLSLVSYEAPTPAFIAALASQQMVYQSQTQTFGPGQHTLTVRVPNCYFQVDLVLGPVIDHFGPAGSNTFYSTQGRLISSGFGGTQPCLPPPTPLGAGTTATIGFWHNRNGQALLTSLNGGPNSTALGNWLASNFPNLYGVHGAVNFTGKSNSFVASYYLNNDFNVTGQKVNAQILAVAFAVYVTNSTLAGNVAAGYGFHVSATGIGGQTINVGSDGAAVGVPNNTTITILQALQAVNNHVVNGVLYGGNSVLINEANDLFDRINTTGDIG